MAKTSIVPMFKRAISYVFAKPATTDYPVEKPQLPDNFRGQMLFDTKLCVGCGLCSRDCPARAIEMVTVNQKKHPQFNLGKCIFCYNCADGCPKKAIKNSTYFEMATLDKSDLTIKPQLTI